MNKNIPALFTKRKQDKIEKADLRTHCISVRLNDDELKKLIEAKGGFAKGEALRLMSFTNMPAQIPAINSNSWASLARTTANLNQLLKMIHTAKSEDWQMIKQAVDEVQQLRKKLLAVYFD